MANTYVVTSASYIPGVPGPDPLITVVGTVNGVNANCTLWKSAYDQAFAAGGVTALKNLVAPLMLAAATANAPPAPVPPTQLITGTFTQ
jgi:hypothetical protein